MAHRRIGQGVFRFGTKAERQTSLDELGALIDWSNADRVLASLYQAVKGEKAWPPLAMFKVGGTSKLLRKGHRHLPAERLEAHNRSLCPIRARIGKIFGTWKRTYRNLVHAIRAKRSGRRSRHRGDAGGGIVP
jgi:hypothetical protein